MTEPTPGTLRADVWLAVYACPEGMTETELDVALTRGPAPMAAPVWRARLAELAEDGAVYVRGERDGAPVWHCRRKTKEPPVTTTDPPNETPVVLLIDGKNLLYRSLLARNGPAVDVDFPQRLNQLYERYQPAFAVVCWDADGPTWRHKAYGDYKAQRAETTTDKREVFGQVPAWAAACGYQFVEAEGWEADDIIGTYCRRMAGGHHVVIVSNDKDLAQLLTSPAVTLMRGADELHEVDVERLWGVPAHRLADYLAVCGDSSDNIPGVPKIGEKGAVSLIKQWGSVEGIIQAAKSGKDKAKARAERIVEHAEALRLFLRLTTVSTGVVGLPALVPCASMTRHTTLAPPLPGMTREDGILYPLPEAAAHMMNAGWRWTNPTKYAERKQAQLRPGEPMERWEHGSHWMYMVESGGQWTVHHRGTDDSATGCETGEVEFARALTWATALHASFRGLHPEAPEAWSMSFAQVAAGPVVAGQAAAATVAAATAAKHLRALRTGGELAGGMSVGVDAALPTGRELGGLGGADIVAEAAPAPATSAVVERPPPPTLPSVPPAAPVVKGPPWELQPASDGSLAVPRGYAYALGALALDSLAQEPVFLVWEVDLKTDPKMQPPPELGDKERAWQEQAIEGIVARLRGVLADHATDGAATRSLLRAVLHNYLPQPLVVAFPEVVNIARLTQGVPPVGRWRLMTRSAIDAIGVERPPEHLTRAALPY